MSDEVAELKKENAKLRLEANLRKSLANQLERQKQVANEAKIELEEKHRNLISSLNYAARIQQTILPTDDAVKQVFPGSYIFWRPQFIVGGDAVHQNRFFRISGLDDRKGGITVNKGDVARLLDATMALHAVSVENWPDIPAK